MRQLRDNGQPPLESDTSYWTKRVDEDGESIYPEPGLAHWCCPHCSACHPFMSMKQVEEFTRNHIRNVCPVTSNP